MTEGLNSIPDTRARLLAKPYLRMDKYERIRSDSAPPRVSVFENFLSPFGHIRLQPKRGRAPSLLCKLNRHEVAKVGVVSRFCGKYIIEGFPADKINPTSLSRTLKRDTRC